MYREDSPELTSLIRKSASLFNSIRFCSINHKFEGNQSYAAHIYLLDTPSVTSLGHLLTWI